MLWMRGAGLLHWVCSLMVSSSPRFGFCGGFFFSACSPFLIPSLDVLAFIVSHIRLIVLTFIGICSSLYFLSRKDERGDVVMKMELRFFVSTHNIHPSYTFRLPQGSANALTNKFKSNC